MKLPSSSRRAGFSLLELLAYMSVFLVVAGMAFSLFYRTEEQGRGLRRSANDLTAALHAGEQWRRDIRSATGPMQADDSSMRIPQPEGDIRYFVEEASLRRQVGTVKPVIVLDRVARAAFTRDQRQFVTGWRCDLELKTRARSSSIRPLFTFTAVPEKGPTQ